MELRIKEGYCYQAINRLLNVTSSKTAGFLMELASTKGAVEISKDKALEKGFEELASWSRPERDRLFVIDNYILICLPKVGETYV